MVFSASSEVCGISDTQSCLLPPSPKTSFPEGSCYPSARAWTPLTTFPLGRLWAKDERAVIFAPSYTYELLEDRDLTALTLLELFLALSLGTVGPSKCL